MNNLPNLSKAYPSNYKSDGYAAVPSITMPHAGDGNHRPGTYSGRVFTLSPVGDWNMENGFAIRGFADHVDDIIKDIKTEMAETEEFFGLGTCKTPSLFDIARFNYLSTKYNFKTSETSRSLESLASYVLNLLNVLHEIRTAEREQR